MKVFRSLARGPHFLFVGTDRVIRGVVDGIESQEESRMRRGGKQWWQPRRQRREPELAMSHATSNSSSAWGYWRWRPRTQWKTLHPRRVDPAPPVTPHDGTTGGGRGAMEGQDPELIYLGIPLRHLVMNTRTPDHHRRHTTNEAAQSI